MLKNKKNRIWRIIIILSILIVVISGIWWIGRLVRRLNANAKYEELIIYVNDLKEPIPESAMASQSEFEETVAEGEEVSEQLLDIEIPQKNLNWELLHKENADIYAWIYIPGTNIDYPVLQHPSDNSYYLNYNMDGTKGYPGCIYTEDYNTKTFADLHTVLYGHNLKDGTMFAALHKYEKEEFISENQYIFIYSQEKVFVYEIFAAYEFDGIHLLDNYDLENEYVYEQYLKDIFNLEYSSGRVANIRSEVEVTKEDRIITLSTCTSDANIRFLVAGVLLNP